MFSKLVLNLVYVLLKFDEINEKKISLSFFQRVADRSAREEDFHTFLGSFVSA